MLALIPARGGSKGLPGKNLRPLRGKPLIVHTIEAALKSKVVTRVVVSTEDAEIARTARSAGAQCPFMRPVELAADDTPSIHVFRYTIDRMEREENAPIPDLIVLQPTSPLRTSADIDGAVHLFKAKGGDAVISVSAAPHPLQWYKYLSSEGRLEDILTGSERRRQECRPAYHPNGAVYVLRRSLLSRDSLYDGIAYAFEMPANRSVDIDSIEDFEFAEFLLARRGS